jgi:hypothetical protein
MKAYSTFLFYLAMAFGSEGLAQLKLSVAPDFVRDPQISEERFQELLTATESALNNYATVGRIYDTKERRVSSTSIKAFNDLFNPAAEVVKDYVEFPPRDLVDFRDYSIEVYNMISDKGIEFLLSDPVLTEIRVKSLGNSRYYMPVVKVNKVVYAFLDRYGALKQSASGNSLDLLLTFEIAEEAMEAPKITKINHGTTIKPADFYNRLIGIYACGGSSVVTPTFSGHWDAVHSNNELNFSGGFNWGIGIDFMTDQFITSKSSPNRRIGFSAGLRFTSISIEANVPEFKTEGSLQTVVFDGVEASGIRSVSSGNITQSLTVNTLSLPIGLDYKFIKSRTLILALHGRVVPSFSLGSNSTLAGTFVHDLYFPEYDLLFSDRNSGANNWGVNADAGSRTFDESVQTEARSFVVGFEVSPTAYLSFEDVRSGWGVLIGADVGYVPGSFIVHQPLSDRASEPLAISSDLPALSSAYLTDMSSLYFGIRVGLFQRNVTQP